MVKFCVYHGLGWVGGVFLSYMKTYFKLNNYYKLYSKTIIVMTVILSGNSNRTGHADFTHEIFPWSTNQNHRYIRVIQHIQASVSNCQHFSHTGSGISTTDFKGVRQACYPLHSQALTLYLWTIPSPDFICVDLSFLFFVQYSEKFLQFSLILVTLQLLQKYPEEFLAVNVASSWINTQQ